MNNKTEKINLETIISPQEIVFSSTENTIAEIFNLTVEELRIMVIESDSLEDFLNKLNKNKEVSENE